MLRLIPDVRQGEPVRSMEEVSILFLWEGGMLTPDGPGGGSALAYSHLRALVRAGCHVHLASLRSEERRPNEILDGALGSRIASLSFLGGAPAARRTRWRRWIRAVRDPVTYEAHGCSEALRGDLCAAVESLRPALVWAEHLRPAALAATASLGVPIVYSHHDWKWKIKQLRSQTKFHHVSERLHYGAVRRAEEALVKQVEGVVTGSITEADEIRALTQVEVAYFPATYDPVEIHDQTVNHPPRIVHLGGMGTTASRQGLERFLDVVWPQVVQHVRPRPEFWVVGSTEQAPDSLRRKFNEIKATCTGFVQDLSTVLRPFDVHIIPWEYDTGTRTRLPVAMNHMQVVLATSAAVAGLSEARNGKNCLLVDRLERMGDVLIEVYMNPGQRERLGRAARRTFKRHLTVEATWQPMASFLGRILRC